MKHFHKISFAICICFIYFNLELCLGNPRLACGYVIEWCGAPHGELFLVRKYGDY